MDGGGLRAWDRAAVLQGGVWGREGGYELPPLLWGLSILPLGRLPYLGVLDYTSLRGVSAKIRLCVISAVSGGDVCKLSMLVQRPGDWDSVLYMEARRLLVPMITGRGQKLVFACDE